LTTIRVTASRAYDVIIEAGLLDRAGEFAKNAFDLCTVAVVSDDRVFALYGQRVLRSFEKAGFRAISYVFPHGEQSKTLATYGKVMNFLCEQRLTRGDAVIALGGGVVGDLAGFAAATYQRGVAFMQIPTTLLAMVDSSVGGKTAVDLDAGKNQAGCFYQPSLVLCDPQTLHTLPEEEYRCGCAEVIKYGVLGNEPFFRELEEKQIREQEEHVIETCVAMKRDIVADDEFDLGQRRLLNLGHSIGHAIEACSGFTLLHGQAVAIGMAIIARAAAQKGCCAADVPARIEKILRAYGLPTKTDYPLDALCAAAGTDKKLIGATMHLVVPYAVGDCRVVSVPASEMREWMRAGGVR